MKIQPGVGYTFDSSSKGFTLDTSDPFPSSTAISETYHPFKVINLFYDEEGSAWLYQVVPGTFNNKVAQIDEDGVWVLLDRTTSGSPNWPTSVMGPFSPSTGKCFIYLRAGAEAGAPFSFPDPLLASDSYPKIINSATEFSDSDAFGYILVAVATRPAEGPVTVNQYVTGSINSDRIKISGMTARYYYARI